MKKLVLCKLNVHKKMAPDFSVRQRAETEANLQKVSYVEHKAWREKMGSVSLNHLVYKALIFLALFPFALIHSIDEGGDWFSEDEYCEFFLEDLVAPQEGRDELIAFLNEIPEKKDLSIEEDDGEEDYDLLERLMNHIPAGGTVVDFSGPSLSSVRTLSFLVGPRGRVHIFEEDRELLRTIYWDLIERNVCNVQLYCAPSGDVQEEVDFLELEEVALIRFDGNGDEDLVILGARETIERCKPVLILTMLAGIPIERADVFLEEEFEKRKAEIEELGYQLHRLSEVEYIALPDREIGTDLTLNQRE
ncbi:MAG: hypothetical protein KR126chlam1_01257 [Chlamydiae bacterium]|nr:hypothetical protein [Chlamydiota bacterium]